MTIGDWSGDGHGRCEDFCVISNMPIEAIRESHFRIKKATGVDIENLCSCYGEDKIPDETVQKLKSLGFPFENSSGMGEGILSVPEMARPTTCRISDIPSKDGSPSI